MSTFMEGHTDGHEALATPTKDGQPADLFGATRSEREMTHGDVFYNWNQPRNTTKGNRHTQKKIVEHGRGGTRVKLYIEKATRRLDSFGGRRHWTVEERRREDILTSRRPLPSQSAVVGLTPT